MSSENFSFPIFPKKEDSDATHCKDMYVTSILLNPEDPRSKKNQAGILQFEFYWNLKMI